MPRRLDGEVRAGAGIVPLPDRGRVARGIHPQLQMLPAPSVTGSEVDWPRPVPSGRAGRALDDEILAVGALPDRGRLALRADRDLRVLYEAVPRLGDADRRRPGPTGRAGRSLNPTALDPRSDGHRTALPAQTAVALPWESTATCGQSARTPVAESVTGADQIPSDERVELSTAPLYSSSQTAVAPPWGSSAICGDRAAFLGGDRETGADQFPPTERVALWTTERQPSSRSSSQTAVTLPSGPATTSGEPAPAAERVTGADQLPPTERVALWTTQERPTRRTQMTVSLPSGSTATCNPYASSKPPEKRDGEDQGPPACCTALS